MLPRLISAVKTQIQVNLFGFSHLNKIQMNLFDFTCQNTNLNQFPGYFLSSNLHLLTRLIDFVKTQIRINVLDFYCQNASNVKNMKSI